MSLTNTNIKQAFGGLHVDTYIYRNFYLAILLRTFTSLNLHIIITLLRKNVLYQSNRGFII